MESTKKLSAEWEKYQTRVFSGTMKAPITMRDVENAFYSGGISSLAVVAREGARDPKMGERQAAIEIFEEVLVKTSSFK